MSFHSSTGHPTEQALVIIFFEVGGWGDGNGDGEMGTVRVS